MNPHEVEYEYSAEKNIQLKQERNISFEEIIYYINSSCLLGVINHPNKVKYKKQIFYVIDVEGYAYLVPFVKDGNKVFLKTIFPSRKATKAYASVLGREKICL